jgi:hypothetical protein
MLPDYLRSVCRVDLPPSPHPLFPLSTHKTFEGKATFQYRTQPVLMLEFFLHTLTPFGFVFLGPIYMHTQRGSYCHPFYRSLFFFLICSFQEISRLPS